MQRSASSVASSQKLSHSPSTASLNAAKKNDATAQGSFEDLMIGYFKSTTPSIRALDGFLTFCFITGVLQAVYCLLVSSFPYNAFIGVFASSVGSFVFAANVRMRWTLKKEIEHREVVHSVTEFLVCTLILHMFVANFIG